MDNIMAMTPNKVVRITDSQFAYAMLNTINA